MLKRTPEKCVWLFR